MTYERVVVSIKSTGPDPAMHVPVEVAWWNLATGERGWFVPAHNVQDALGGCHVDTIRDIGYLDRLAQADQDEKGHQAALLAEALQSAVMVSMAPLADDQLLRRMFAHYLNDFEFVNQDLYLPEWHDVLDVGSYADGALGLGTLPDLGTICQRVGVPLEAARTAESDVEALGRCVLRLAELVDNAGRAHHRVGAVPAVAELSHTLIGRLDNASYDLVNFHDNGEGEAQTYTINTGTIAEVVSDTYGPALAALTDEATLSDQKFQQLAEQTTKITQEWEARCNLLTVERDQAMAAAEPITDEQLRFTVGRAIAGHHGEGESFDKDNDRGYWLNAATAALEPVAVELHNLRRKIGQVIATHVSEVNELRAELAENQASRQAWATEAMDLEQGTRHTPWEDPFSLPVTELSIGPATAPSVPSSLHAGDVVPGELAPEFEVDTPSATAMAVGPTATVIGPISAGDIVAYLAQSAPQSRPCPNTPPCDHRRDTHGIWSEDDPIAVCWDDGCQCGQPPAGWRRIENGQRVWGNGDLVPAGVFVLTTAGEVWPENDASQPATEPTDQPPAGWPATVGEEASHA
jgi:hypothetical protein